MRWRRCRCPNRGILGQAPKVSRKAVRARLDVFIVLLAPYELIYPDDEGPLADFFSRVGKIKKVNIRSEEVYITSHQLAAVRQLNSFAVSP